jgi:hypothetical protein
MRVAALAVTTNPCAPPKMGGWLRSAIVMGTIRFTTSSESERLTIVVSGPPKTFCFPCKEMDTFPLASGTSFQVCTEIRVVSTGENFTASDDPTKFWIAKETVVAESSTNRTVSVGPVAINTGREKSWMVKLVQLETLTLVPVESPLSWARTRNTPRPTDFVW